MNLQLATFSVLLAAVNFNSVFASSRQQLPKFGNNIMNKIDINGNGFSASSKAAAGLIASSTRVLEDEGDEQYYNYVTGYSVKFQGCHHISQWNSEAEGDDTVRIRSKRMVRYRLCPTGSCDDNYDGGCKSKYGDYVVDLNTFVYYYLMADAEEQEERCNVYQDVCDNECGVDDPYDYCQQKCLANHGIRNNCEDDENNIDFDVVDYAQCAAYDDFQGDDDYGNQYYVGPYCAEQGGSVYLGLFTDDTCTTFANCGDTCFYNKMGFKLPYGDDSLVDSRCMSCSNNYMEKEQGAYYSEEQDEMREFCKTIYTQSGKCEARMNTQYPNESACTFIEGIKVIRNDGVLRTSGMRKSRPAAVAIGLMATSAVLLTAYVYYLRTKLSRAKVNLTSTAAAVYA